MSNKILVTYFGPFNHFKENPAELIADKLQLKFLENKLIDFKKLQVSFEGIDQFLCQNLEDYDYIIEIGVATKSEKVRLEIYGTNFVSGIDIHGVQKIGKINENDSEIIKTAFDDSILIECCNEHLHKVIISQNAGKFLCNYLYFKSLKQFNSKKILFIHLANFLDFPSAITKDVQVKIIHKMIEKISRNT
jgi:pyroglutamyl-peptidase